MAKTINLDTRTTPDICKELVDLEFNYGHDKSIRKYSHQMFARQKQQINKLFSDWLQEINSNLLNDIELFVKESLSTTGLFEQTKCSFLHAANVILGMPSADYAPTLDSIEQHINDIYDDLKVLRIESGLSKKSNLLEALSQIRGEASVLVIIDRTETIDPPLLKSLTDSLYELLRETSADRVIVLFCMSNSSHTIEKILPIRIRTLMNNVKTIVKDPGEVFKQTSAKILMNGDFSFNLHPKTIDAIRNDFIYNDPSVTNLKYLCQCSLFYHYIKNKSYPKNSAILLLPQTQLAKILKSEPDLISSIKELKSMNSKVINGCNWNDANAVASLCCNLIQELRNYHQFILGQMLHYLDMILDTTGAGFDDLNDIYNRLVDYDDFGHSPMFVSEISNLQKYPTASILERLEKSTSYKMKFPKLKGKFTDVHSILMEFKEKLINNDNSRDIVIELINRLLKHTQELKNPLKMPLNEVLFYYDLESLENRALPNDWAFTPKDFIDRLTPFGILYDLIQAGAEEISAVDLFNDFKCRFEELERRKLMDIKLSSSGVKLKVRPKKLRNTTVPIRINDNSEEIIDEGLLKALFLDLLIDMENMGLLKSDKKMSAKGTVKVCHWFD